MTDKFPRVFLARAGKDGEDEDYVLEHGLAVIGFTGYGSLEHAKDYDDVYKLVAAADPDANPHMVGNYAGQLWAFAISMREGDTVALPRKLTSQVALGTVVGPYKYQRIDGVLRHTRPVKWIRPDVPRSVFKQDLLASFGAAMTVCNITRHDAARRVATVLAGGSDPGQADTVPGETPPKPEGPVEPPEPPVDLTQLAHDQIVEHIQAHFRGHDLARLVDAVLNAEGWTTKVSPPGPDGGVDILAGRGSLGLDQPRLCVQEIGRAHV